jgi:hypothetical protein
MKNRKARLFTAILFIAGLAVSCSEDETRNDTIMLELKFPSTTEPNGKSYQNFGNYIVTIRSTEPLVIISNDLIVVKAVDQVTGKLSYVIVQKEKVNLEESSASRALLPDPGIRKGYMYDGKDCFIWGTIVTTSGGNVYFYPSNSATQLLMNRCGYSNVA